MVKPGDLVLIAHTRAKRIFLVLATEEDQDDDIINVTVLTPDGSKLKTGPITKRFFQIISNACDQHS